uniref:hypothetical protein n=1 Tax=Roseivirga sp. TaxID=1964215 RepID=UPI00404799A2
MKILSNTSASKIKGGIGCNELAWAALGAAISGKDRKAARLDRRYDRRQSNGKCPDRFELFDIDPENLF